MNGNDLRLGREQKGWTQEEASSRLGVSQPYLSLLEKGRRRVTPKLARQAAGLLALPPTTLPVETGFENVPTRDMQTLAADLASLGYPGFAYLKRTRKKNPAEVLLSALSAKSLETRVVEALPWVLFTYPELDWSSLTTAAKVRDLQNKLGFVTALARKVAEKRGETWKANLLRQQEKALDRSRLVSEDSLGNDRLSRAERSWFKTNRPAEAKHWRVLTDLSPEHLSYAS